MRKIIFILIISTFFCVSLNCFASSHAGDGVKLFRVTTETERDIFDDAGGMIEYKKFTETDSLGGGEFCAGAYVYNNSLTNGDCVEMNIIIVEYSGTSGFKIPDAFHIKTVHACPGDNGKFVYTEPFSVDSSKAVKAMIWGKEKIIPYASSSGYIK